MYNKNETGVIRPANPALKVMRKPAPFPGFFGLPKPEDEKKLHKMEQGWNRWDATRHLNPFIEGQTASGFEGYFIGLGFAPEEVAEKIAQMGCATLKHLKMMHPGDGSHIRSVWKVAQGEKYDKAILAELNASLLSNIGRLRIQIHPKVNRVGDAFRNSVAKMVESEKILYHGENGKVEEHTIAVPPTRSQAGAIIMSESVFSKDELLEGYRFMTLLGKAGYPLVQLAIHR